MRSKHRNSRGVATPLQFASDEEILAATGVHPGSLGPIDSRIPCLVDHEAAALSDFVCGANEDGKHFTGVNWAVDCPITDDQQVDMRNVVEGDPAPGGQGKLKFLKGIEVGHIFQLGTVYSAAMDATVLGQDGRNLAPIMGCYGMGVTRLVAAVIEQNHDDEGICWPQPAGAVSKFMCWASTTANPKRFAMPAMSCMQSARQPAWRSCWMIATSDPASSLPRRTSLACRTASSLVIAAWKTAWSNIANVAMRHHRMWQLIRSWTCSRAEHVMAPALRQLIILGLLITGTSLFAAEAVDPELREKLALNMAADHAELDRFDATVWLQVSDQRLQRFIKQPEDRLRLLQLVYREASVQSLDPDLVLALMQIESAFDQYAISHAGALGLMQVMPFWRLEIGRPQDNLTNMETNIRYGTVILAHYIDVAKGDLVDALARYNGSRGRLKYPRKSHRRLAQNLAQQVPQRTAPVAGQLP